MSGMLVGAQLVGGGLERVQWDIEMSAGAQDLPHGRNVIHGEIGADAYPVLT
jgi:hypothetical protein